MFMQLLAVLLICVVCMTFCIEVFLSDFIEQSQYFSLSFSPEHVYACLSEIGQTLEKRGCREMPANVEDAAVFVYAFDGFTYLASQDGELLFNRNRVIAS